MKKLEKILEEMKESSITVATSKEHYIHPQDGRFVEEVVLLDDIEKIIHKHMNDGWIPVDEQLPKEYGEYLVTIVPSAGYLWARRIIANFSDLMGIVKKHIFYTGEVGKLISKILPIWLSHGALFQSPTAPRGAKKSERS